jgi:hypothetical protein
MDLAPQIEATGLFDDVWYRWRYPDVAASGAPPLQHYAQYGHAERRAPNAYFDTEWYCRSTATDSEPLPLLHYARVGEHAGIPPGPNFNPAWYRRTYALEAHAGALGHYLSRRPEGHLPAPIFFGVAGYWPAPARPAGIALIDAWIADRTDRQMEISPEPEIIGDSGLFDVNFYLINGSDVHRPSIDPVRHFCDYGWREGRDTNPYFHTAWYRATNPEVMLLDLNPLVHYIVAGEARDRRPVAYFEPGWYRETYSVPADRLALAHFLAHRHDQRVSPNRWFDVAAYRASAARLGPHNDPFAHYLQAATYADIDPSPRFAAAQYRQRHRGRRTRHFPWLLRPELDNPLVHAMEREYERQRLHL